MRQQPKGCHFSRFLAGGLIWFTILGCFAEKSLGAENKSKQNVMLDIFPDFSGNHLVTKSSKIQRRMNDLMEESSKTVSKLTPGGGGQLPKIDDPGYLSINRFEGPIRNETKRVAKRKESIGSFRILLPSQKKKLIFSGKGFEIGDFEKHYEQKLIVDYHYHINFDNRKTFLRKPRPSLDLEEENLGSRRSLVFHHPITLMTEPEEIESESEFTPKNQFREVIPRSPAISETKILMDQDPKFLLKLRSNPNVIDLLASNERWNRKRFYSAE